MKDSKLVMGNIRKQARRGVSLIEVLVVLVLLVLGILIIVRLFPSGFFSITSVGNAALADGLGQAAVQGQAQNTAGLPESILPVPQTNDLTPATASDANYSPDFNPSVEPDYSKILDKARVINNETITIPAASGSTRQSVYVVNYGPIVMPVAMTATQLPNYLSINSPYWNPLSGTYTDAAAPKSDYPQDTLSPGQQQFFVDYTNGRLAVPYARTYTQAFVLMVVATDPTTKTDKLYTLDLKVPHSGAASPATTDPIDLTSRVPYPDSQTYYNGGWFDPAVAANNLDAGGKTYTYNTDTSPATPPLPWKSVMLYRPFSGVADTSSFTTDPYQFTLTSPNITDTSNASLANVGAIAFNPLAAGGSGTSALKARISYVTYSWKVLHEDRDIPALTGSDTAVTRLTLKNLKRAGDNNPDNSIYTGLIPNSFLSLIALDLDTGKTVGNGGPVFDPTTGAEGKINDEDLNGTNADPTYINASFSTGRVTFGAQVFSDITPKAHRVRLFYMGDADWTVAVQKASSYYTLSPNTAAGGADPMLLPGQYAFDGTQNLLYFPRSDAGKSVEIDGTYVTGSGATAQVKTFASTIAIPAIVTTIGNDSYVTVNLTDPTLTGGLQNANAAQGTVAVSAVRGLSVRSVVAWKERDLWKVHSVDTVLNRAQ